MSFKPMNTSNIHTDEPTKTLCYGHMGFGKTWQCRNYQKRFGKGFIISGEAGLKSVGDEKIDYLPFTSWDGPHDPSEGVYSFRGIVKMIGTEEFQAQGYKWIAIDSLTELSDRLMEHVEEEHKGSANGFAMWGDYNRLILGAIKWVRDLPVHVYMTSLAREEEDDNGMVHYWPMMKGKGAAKQIAGMFDHVFCGIRITETQPDGSPKIKRFLVTDEVKGWHGKSRDPYGRMKPIEKGDDITELLARVAEKVPEPPPEPDELEACGFATPETAEKRD